jgi:hypothetical protein
MIEQRSKRARADILTADEPQPVEPLLSGARSATSISKISGLDRNAGPFHVASCCRLFTLFSGYFRAFPKIAGGYKRRGCDTNSQPRWAVILKLAAVEAHGSMLDCRTPLSSEYA